jgi:ABC-type branched-subunit amino acid transport system substrate-binding protein
MSRGQELAVDEINAAGGVAGYQLELVKVDTQAQQPDVMKTVLQNLVSQNVAAVFMPFCSYTSVEFPIVADKKIPTFHVNTCTATSIGSRRTTPRTSSRATPASSPTAPASSR